MLPNDISRWPFDGSFGWKLKQKNARQIVRRERTLVAGKPLPMGQKTENARDFFHFLVGRVPVVNDNPNRLHNSIDPFRSVFKFHANASFQL